MIEMYFVEIRGQRRSKRDCRQPDREVAHERCKVPLRPTEYEQRYAGMRYGYEAQIYDRIDGAGIDVVEMLHCCVVSYHEKHVVHETVESES